MATTWTKGFLAVDKPRIVSTIVVTASGTADGVAPFHWRFYTVLNPAPQDSGLNSASVLFDMIPVNDNKGCLMVASKIQEASTAPLKVELRIPCATECTTHQIFECLTRHGLDRYLFTENGTGCLFWVLKAVEQLGQAGYVDIGAIDKLRAFRDEEIQLHPARHPDALREGTFYW